jgi:soluble lytic murein transglycosylase
VYALTRAESAFMADARSPAGALGLMQVMPATGKETANSINFRTYSNDYLLEPEKNITIGTAYLKQVFDRFNNVVLATAAYNAGPNAVAKWLPEDECIEPDIWVERIPYTETRKYVARIIFYAAVYDWRLNNEMTRINRRMSIISPRKVRLVADLSCPVSDQVSGL